MRKPYERFERRTAVRSAVGWLVQAGGFRRLTMGLALVVTVVASLLSSCATAPASREDKAALVAEAASRWQQMRAADPALGALVQRGHGYALFPDIGKAGLGVGGAYGRGVVYERGQHIGYSDLT
jgi:lipid-binding SYLF domain-containing protein